MSKLGAICDKLRQNGPSDLTNQSSLAFADDHGGSACANETAAETPVGNTDGGVSVKRRTSPDNRLNKRKNFRPVSNSIRNGQQFEVQIQKSDAESRQNSEEPSAAPASSLRPTKLSVIVRNPAKTSALDLAKSRRDFDSPKQANGHSSPVPDRDGREDTSISRKPTDTGYRLPSPDPPASSSSFYQTEVFPFMDYQNMMFDAHLRQSERPVGTDGPENIDNDMDSMDDSDDGKFSNGERHSMDGKPAVKRKRRENGSHDSANFKWSGVRNSIRSLDIWQYVKHFRSDETCHSSECRSLGLKEHFHCLTCTNPNKVIFRKEEMIRHVKWHKKRDETLQLGFLRFSGNDDCAQQFRGCPHAGRQTHYHCLMSPCQKVYTSTSDVQMHANLHRKEVAINKEGFQRYRAMDDCREESCPFREHKSTHFHCIRSTCTFTFKNKADMEKHKAYHAKNDELAKDGFRKYMKYEHCLFHDQSCPYSKIMNHIHCIRQACRYVFTSSAQLHAHKRKHDKHAILKSNGNLTVENDGSSLRRSFDSGSSNVSSDADDDAGIKSSSYVINSLGSFSSDEDEINSPLSATETRSGISRALEKSEKVYNGKVKFNTALLRAAEAANMRRRQPSGDDFFMAQAGRINHPESTVRKNMSVSHSTLHMDNRDGPSYSDFLTSSYPSSGSQNHSALYRQILPSHMSFNPSTSQTLNEYKPASAMSSPNFGNSALTSQIPSIQPSYPTFKRKRGRPPKNPVVDVHIFPSTPNSNRNPQAMFSSFKIGKGGVLMDIRQESAAGHRSVTNTPPEKPKERNVLPKLSQFTERMPNKSPHCSYHACSYKGRDHYHCTHPRCHFGSERDDILALHTREFHANIIILEGYEFYDQCVDCGFPGCTSNRLTRHFHCTRPSCLYSFVRYDTMGTHEEKHRLALTCPSPATSPRHTPGSFFQDGYIKTEMEEMKEIRRHPIKTEPDVQNFEEKRFFCHPMLSKMHFSADQPCALQGRCRLAEREHFHCSRCDFAYTSVLRLQTHITKCQVQPTPAFHQSRPYSRSPSFASSPKSQHHQSPSLHSDMPNSPNSSSPASSLMDFDCESVYDQPTSTSSGSAMQKLKFISMAYPQTGRGNGQQQQPIPDGFQRFLCTETCDWEECPLSRKQTHWHCREDHCRQFFSDKTRLERHSERHRRLSTIIGDDFRRYSAKVTCDDPVCTLKSSSHVHCLQCDFVCTETAKIATHRRSHSKQNAVKNAGFDKYSFRSPCSVSSCLYFTQTHYHCRTCSVVVNTMSQMQAHQNKHDQKGDDDSMAMDFNCDLGSNSF